MISRRLTRSPHYIETPGNKFSANLKYAGIWNIIMGDASHSIASDALQHVHRTFPEDPLVVAEICSGSSLNTSRVVRRIIEELRESSDREVMISPTYIPLANWSEYIQFAMRPENYGGLANVYLFLRPSGIWKQIYPSASVHLVFTNHGFLPLSKVPVAPDTIWSTLSEDPQTQKELRDIGFQDLDALLTLRHRELKTGGRFVFDLFTEHEHPRGSIFHLLNHAYQKQVDSGKITQEERDRTTLRFNQRDPEVLNTILEKHRENFRVVTNEYMPFRYPAWEQYESSKDVQAIAQEYSDWLKEWTSAGLMRSLSQNRTQEEKTAIITEMYEDLTSLIAQDPIPLDLSTQSISLEKIN